MKHLSAFKLGFNTPAGRPLIRDLSMRIEADRVALVGRNGVGKSTLLSVLAGVTSPDRGRVQRVGRLEHVPQSLQRRSPERWSPGQERKLVLREAFRKRPDFLLLDEPSQELDEEGACWLKSQIASFGGGLIVVSHDRRLLTTFDSFFVVAESGCRLVRGGFDSLLTSLEEERTRAAERYDRRLAHLETKEDRNSKIKRRRERKRAGGRVRELGRCPARVNLNAKRGYAEVYQGKREGVRQQRLEAARTWAKTARRALAVDLPLDLPQLPSPEARSMAPISLRGLTTAHRGAVTLPKQSLTVARNRMAVVGPNGSGKSTLIHLMTGQLTPDTGTVRFEPSRVGVIGQHAGNWKSEESLLEILLRRSDVRSLEEASERLARHRFPLSLGERPMVQLSPGERTRAALIALFHQSPMIEVLILDEPTVDLDLSGLAALERVLSQFEGGLVVVSHDTEFLRNVRIQQRIDMGESSTVEVVSAQGSGR